MRTTDVALEITYDMNSGEASIETNMNRTGVEEVLETWVRAEVMKEKDEREPNRLDVFRIKIGVSLEDDTLFIESDTGNRSLTLGLVGDVLNQLNDIVLRPFAPQAVM